MQGDALANGPETHCDWNAIDWKKANRSVRNLRQRIFRATEQRNWRKVKSLQKLMLRSYANIVLSVRRVSQINQGKNTPGIDKLVVKTPEERGKLVDELAHLTPWRAKPVRRVYIPKANGKWRPLGIPVIRDRALQAIAKNALEPSWEARFERTSYGFRPGRSAQDAMTYIYCALHLKSKPFVVDADIAGAFDTIGHDYLLAAIAGFPAKALVKQWLKAGSIEMGQYHNTEAGVPQGGVISPLLANIALHGLAKLFDIHPAPNSKTTNRYLMTRYADDFLVFCKTRQDAQEAVERLHVWLAQRGLALSLEKTRITTIQEGFDFLGFTARVIPSKLNKSGWKVLITPSVKSVQKLKDRLKQEWESLQGQNVATIIQRLNPIIRGWANYFRHQAAANTFKQLDNFMLHKEIRYAKRMHPNRSKAWWRAKYFGQLEPDRNCQWVFGDTQTGFRLLRFSRFTITRHIMVQGTNSPDDPKLQTYWLQRECRKSYELPGAQRRLAQRQHGQCPVCGESLFSTETLEQHHVIARKTGGPNTLDNKILVHYFCHQQLTANQYKQHAFRSSQSA
jgi:RNA-directed DNA polymerase